ncbi:MAG: transglycosylase SLT domain-containing protein [Pseudomonadota bacterium]
MRVKAGLIVSSILGCVFTLLPWATAQALSEQALADGRQDYKNAVAALERGRLSDYQRLRAELDGYPLAIYLDYQALARRGHRVSPAEARAFLARTEGTPLPVRYLSLYLRQLGKRQRWAGFLEVQPDEPNSVVLKCYYYRAHLAAGNHGQAWRGAQTLWVHGRSQPDECDPLFDAWQRAGERTDELVWQRLLAAFDERQTSLLRYVARKGSSRLKPWSDRLLQVYADPSRMRSITLPPSSPYAGDIAAHGLVYLARYSPERALDYWQRYQLEMQFTPAQIQQVDEAIALRSLFARTDAHRAWLQEALSRLQDDKLTGIRLRWALVEGDWQAVAATLPLYTMEAQSEGKWRYWQARVWERDGETERARQLFEGLAQERGYYSFLAAEHLGKPHAFNHQPLNELDSQAVATLPGVMRVRELVYHGEPLLAHSEWHHLVGDSDEYQRLQLAQLALGRSWYRMAIDAANRGGHSDALDLRFPTPFLEAFEAQAVARAVPTSELLAIARRESAFFPEAMSPVGARGLMQIMPATGKQVARSLGKSHSVDDLYDVEHNVLLGSTYYRELLDRYSDNRIFALAAYNAGPHRVDRWRRSSGDTLEAAVWIEAIPFKETRNYVQAVLSYNLVFQYLMGDTQSLLTDREERALY